MVLISVLFSFLTMPFRRMFRFAGARSSGPTLKSTSAIAKSSVSATSKRAGDAPRAHGVDDPPASRVQVEASLLFRRLQRPTLVERTAADVSLEEARAYAAQAEKFYTQPFSLFARSDFFYEEVEQEYLDEVLGRHNKAADMNFLGVMTVFRKTLNDNTRRILMIYAPLIMVTAIAVLALFGQPLCAAVQSAIGVSTPGSLATDGRMIGARIAVVTGVFAGATSLLLLLYHWPYKVTQQQNLLGLDNYITSKFSRINQNFQVAKRRAMNVERTMRMPQADELREEAGVWTVAYNWLAMRLLLCELTVRNAVYQVRRNTTLYGGAGAVMSLFIGAGAVGAFNAAEMGYPGFAVDAGVLAGVFVLVAFGAIMGRATADTLSVLQPEEWNRFHHVDLHESIRDHVGEDKLQIVTFRDRNRLE